MDFRMRRTDVGEGLGMAEAKMFSSTSWKQEKACLAKFIL
jgi:hypothetical protein